MYQNRIIIFFLLAVLGGCAAPRAIEDYSHIPAGDYQIDKTTNVNLAFDSAWDRAVQSLSSTFYTINNIEKNSRIINVSFRLNDPTKYIDCGISNRAITYKKKPREFQYETAGSTNYEYLWYTSQRYHIWTVANRNSSVSGVANIYFNPLSENQTSITVNINYLLKTKLSGKHYSYRNSGEYLFDSNFSDTIETEITTNTPSQFGGNDPDTICKSKQVLEEQLLSILTGA